MHACICMYILAYVQTRVHTYLIAFTEINKKMGNKFRLFSSSLWEGGDVNGEGRWRGQTFGGGSEISSLDQSLESSRHVLSSQNDIQLHTIEYAKHYFIWVRLCNHSREFKYMYIPACNHSEIIQPNSKLSTSHFTLLLTACQGKVKVSSLVSTLQTIIWSSYFESLSIFIFSNCNVISLHQRKLFVTEYVTLPGEPQKHQTMYIKYLV